MSTLQQQVWLILRNDLRQIWRAWITRRGRAALGVLVVGVLFAAAHLGLWFLFKAIGHVPPIAEAGYWLFFGTLMLGTGMHQAVGLLYERADFDLLLSSPVRPAAVLAARLLAVAAAAAMTVGVFVPPLVDMEAVVLGWRYLWGYVAWGLLALGAGSAGVVLAMALVRWIGVRRTRVVAQILGAVFGAGMYLIFQLGRYLPQSVRQTLAQFGKEAMHWRVVEGIAGMGHGEPVPLLVLALVSGGLAVFAVRKLAGTFVTASQESMAAAPSRSGAAVRHRWTEGLMLATVRKELRLIRRDPLLLAQVLPSILYVLPALLAVGKLGGVGLLAPLAVVVFGQFTMVLTSVVAAGEEAWDLIQMSPAPVLPVRLAKLMAGLTMPAIVAAVACVVLAGAGRPVLALAAYLTGAVVGGAVGWLQVTHIVPAPRRDLMRQRRAGRSLWRQLASTFLYFTGTGAIAVAAHGVVWLALILGAVVWVAALSCFVLVDVQLVGGYKAPGEAA